MSGIFASKTDRAFYQTVFTVVVALAATGFIFFRVYQLFGLYLLALIHKIKDACGCADMTQFFSMHPDIFRAIVVVGIGIGIFIFYSLYKLIKLIFRTKKYTEYYLSFAKAETSAKLKKAIKSLKLDEAKIIEINKSDLAVFCFGYWRPMICVSSGLINLLNKSELKSVLAHEARHMIYRDPLKSFIVKYSRSVFFFLPGIKISVKKYLLFSELAADEKASEGAEGRFNLASAMLKISEQEEKSRLKSGSFLSFFNSGMEERANRLSDKAYIPKFKFLDKNLIACSSCLAIISFIFIFIFSSGTKALEMHGSSGCIAMDNSNSDLFCSLAGWQKNGKTKDETFYDAKSINFHENSACKAE